MATSEAGTATVSFGNSGTKIRGLRRIPREALVRGPVIEGESSSLFVATAGRAEERQVEIVDVFGAHVTVSGAVEPDDRVILAAAGRD